jgi:hypothetical protein
MRKFAFLSVAVVLAAISLCGCDETNPAEPNAVTEPGPVPDLSRQSPASSLRGLYSTWAGATATLAPGGYIEKQVRCPDGMFATGGGGQPNNTEWVLQASRPGNYLDGKPTAWWAGFKNVGASSQTSYYETQVICTKLSGY